MMLAGTKGGMVASFVSLMMFFLLLKKAGTGYCCKPRIRCHFYTLPPIHPTGQHPGEI